MSSPSVVQETRRSIQSAGYTPLPVLNGTKRAAEKGWQNLAKQNPPPCVAVNAWPDAASLSTGVFCGEIVIAIDIDVDNPTLAEQVFNAGIAYLGSSPMRYRDGSARRFLPFGGQVDQTALHNLAMKTAHRVVQSQHYGIMGWIPEARQIWTVEYERLSGGLPGLTGAMCARAEAQTLRLALVYAVLDGSRNIAPPHLIAALEVWRYCEDSVRFIFGSASGDSTADEIARMLKNTPEGATLTQISSHFGRNKSSDELSRALNSLKTAGRVSESRLQTGGRPSSVWILTA